MNKLEEEIQRLKSELDRKKEELSDLRKLVGRDVDREFPPAIEGMSDRELEIHLRDTIPLINGFVETKPDLRELKSHRKVFGRPIAAAKRALLETTLRPLEEFIDRQVKYNRQAAALLQALHQRSGRYAARIKALEERVAACEEDLVLLKSAAGIK
ncbi:MAG: hypothetical protein JW843_11755 [Candidatus Aminicenantes bacterium]|nr:hypothetical protein [Candidatus Aminicenantes bacterium]